jgi:PKD repeat protein
VRRPGCFEITGAPVFLRVAKLPVAAFSVDVSEELAVFTNTSVGGDLYHWDFGDGQSSEDIDPQHTYAGEGLYTVTLTVFNTCDTVSISQEINILLLPNAAFSIPDSIQACGDALVNFVNQSSENATSFLWLFPGGTPEFSSFMNPFVDYSQSGDYPVTLIVSNNSGSDTIVQTLHVEILGLPAAQFTYTILPNGVVEFVNTSNTGAGFMWDFGDGTPAVDADSAVSHTYPVNGSYTVTLVASNICGASVFQQMIEVNTGSVGTNDLNKTNAPRLYPNPAKDYLVVDCTAVNMIPDQMRILDLTGRVVLVKNSVSDLKTTISLQELPAGAYWVEVRTGAQVWRRLVVRG